MERATSIKLSSAVGLLTTVHQLPKTYQVQYIKIKAESPLDLTIKPFNDHMSASITPPSTPSPLKKRYRETEIDQQFTIIKDEIENKILSPLKKRYRESEDYPSTQKSPTVVLPPQQIADETTPKKSPSTKVNHKSSKNPPQTIQLPPKERKSKAIRKLKFDEFRSSPVSGTIIRTLEEIDENDLQESGDIDPQYNIVEVTDEAKSELAQIPNVIGAYLCKLCRIEFEDAFGLARHRCNCIVLLEYRCPECGKKFNCPANLASHRRWHKPRDQMTKKSETTESEPAFPCSDCGKNFKRQAYLKKHQATHTKKSTSSSGKEEKKSSSSKLSLANVNSNSHHETSSVSSFNAFSSRSHDSADVLIPQPVFSFNNRNGTVSPAPSTDSSEHELVINENSNSSINSMISATSDTQSHYKMLSNRFTEDENIAITALANLRSGSSVIRHTLTV